MSTHTVRLMIVDMEERIGDTTVLGLGHVKVIRCVLVIDGDVLEHGITFDGTVNIGFRLLGKINGLGVASTLKVENSIIIPSVLVITDEFTFGICTQRGLSRSAQSKEKSCGTVVTKIRTTMHGHDSVKRQPIVHHREDTFFHLSTVPVIFFF